MMIHALLYINIYIFVFFRVSLYLLPSQTIIFQPFEVQDMIALYGKHESMLNELKFRFKVSTRWDNAQMHNFLTFVRNPLLIYSRAIRSHPSRISTRIFANPGPRRSSTTDLNVCASKIVVLCCRER